jgi:hypothetical protein
MSDYGQLLRHHGEPPVTVRRLPTVEDVLKEADVRAAKGGGAAGKNAHWGELGGACRAGWLAK